MDPTKLEDLVPKLENMNEAQLMTMLTSLETLLKKTKEYITAKVKSPVKQPLPSPKTPPLLVDDNLFQFDHQPNIDDRLLSEVLDLLNTLTYHPSAKTSHSPGIHLFGSQKYVYNKQSSVVTPTPIESESPISKLLEVVNDKIDTNFNSVLINRYRNIKCFLGAHKDNEDCLDPGTPISTLSLGATRRLHISLNTGKRKPVKTLILTPGSIFTMLPGFQDQYYHSIAAGIKGAVNEKGVRYSITFRRLTPSTDADVDDMVTDPTKEPIPIEEEETSLADTAATDENESSRAPDTFVFGSSLLKGLDETILSKYTKNFKVFCNRGARVRNIYEDMEKVKEDGMYDTTKVSNVFLLCGGNDVENFDNSNNDNIKFLFEDIEDLVDLTREVFPHAKINYISLIPRRSQYKDHIRNMHQVNDWLSRFCKKESIRFVDIFSFFVVKIPSMWMLNDRLFNRSKLHFSNTGDSVLAKVLMGVANKPR